MSLKKKNPDRMFMYIMSIAPYFEMNFNFEYLIPIAIASSIIEKGQEYIMEASKHVIKKYAETFKKKK